MHPHSTRTYYMYVYIQLYSSIALKSYSSRPFDYSSDLALWREKGLWRE